MAEAFPDQRGRSYGGIRYYYEGGPSEPRIDLLQAIASVLGIRWEWLAFDDGPMTREEAIAQEEGEEARRLLEGGALEEMRAEVLGALEGELPRIKSSYLSSVARLTSLIEPLVSRPPWLLRHKHLIPMPTHQDTVREPRPGGVRGIRLETAIKEAAIREVARAVRAPADALGVDLNTLSDTHFDLYVDALCAALATLLVRPHRMLAPDPDRRRAGPEGIAVGPVRGAEE